METQRIAVLSENEHPTEWRFSAKVTGQSISHVKGGYSVRDKNIWKQTSQSPIATNISVDVIDNSGTLIKNTTCTIYEITNA